MNFYSYDSWSVIHYLMCGRALIFKCLQRFSSVRVLPRHGRTSLFEDVSLRSSQSASFLRIVKYFSFRDLRCQLVAFQRASVGVFRTRLQTLDIFLCQNLRVSSWIFSNNIDASSDDIENEGISFVILSSIERVSYSGVLAFQDL